MLAYLATVGETRYPQQLLQTLLTSSPESATHLTCDLTLDLGHVVCDYHDHAARHTAPAVAAAL